MFCLKLLSQPAAWEVLQEILNLKEEECPKTILFVWEWWSVQNKLNRGEMGLSRDEITGEVMRLMCELGRKEMQVLGKIANIQQRWKPPLAALLKINNDGAFISETWTGAWGFIFSYHLRHVIVAVAGHLLVAPNVLTTETMACSMALFLATDYGISKIQPEVDSTVLKQALSSPLMDLAACGTTSWDVRDLL